MAKNCGIECDFVPFVVDNNCLDVGYQEVICLFYLSNISFVLAYWFSIPGRFEQ